MKLCHLFPDLMDLYGDYGNLLALGQALAAQGLDVETADLRPGEDWDLSQADFLYMGPGTEPAGHKALELLRPHAAALRAALDRGVPMLFTGNSWLGLGQSLTTADGQVLDGLGLFPFRAVERWERYTGDAIALPLEGDPTPAVGFLNRCDAVEGVDTPLFTLEMGVGNAPGSPLEGLRSGSLFATHLIGPLLVKNPHLLARLAQLLGAAPTPPEPDSHAQLAYQVTLDALRRRQG